MKIVKRKPKPARQVLLRMVTDTAVCGAIAGKWKNGGLFASRGENLIGEWAVKHFKRYGKAPRRDIGNYYDRWAAKQSDDEISEFMGRFLESLSEECKKTNEQKTSSAIILDTASEVFDEVAMNKMKDEISAAIEMGDLKRARKVIGEYRNVEVASTAGISVLKGGPIIHNAIRSIGKPVITWQGDALNKFFATALGRQEFVTFVGPEKSAKSFHLQRLAFQGVVCKCNVAFFETGDQSQDQILRRFAAFAARRPYKEDRLVRIPAAMEPSPDGPPEIAFDEKTFDKPITPKEASLALKAIGRVYGKDRLRLSVHPNSSINVHGIESILQDWKRLDDWIPDVIVIDYADILAPIEGRADTRDQINATWKALRSMNQRWDCLMLTATQADAASYDATIIDKGNFSEDKRKNAHVTGAIGINQDSEEKEKQIARLNWLLARDLEFSTRTCLYCAQCLAVADPMVMASF